jgi:hypothetical protein
MFGQGNDFPGQRPDHGDTLGRGPRHEIVVPAIRHAVFGGDFSVHREDYSNFYQ